MSYSLASLLQEYSENKEQIHAEGYDNTDNINTGLLIALLLTSLIIWAWAATVTLMFWKHLPDWAKVVAIMGLIPIIPGGPIATLVVVYITGRHGKKKSKKK